VAAQLTEPDAGATRAVHAAPEEVWRMVTDLGSIASRSPETFSARWTRGDGPVPGARFRGWNRNGPFVWTTTCTVIAAAPGEEFSFEVSWLGLPIATWQWTVEPSGDASTVTLRVWDRRGRFMRSIGAAATGVRDRRAHNQAGIEATLYRLAAES
jgi:uncharacterized protein YndB with AHSA1/START domain